MKINWVLRASCLFFFCAHAQTHDFPTRTLYWESWPAHVFHPLEQPVPTDPTLRVVAWNVGQTKFSGDLQKKLETNLEGLLISPGAPDLLLLVEANKSTVDTLKKTIFTQLGYQAYAVPYNVKYPWAYFVVLWKTSQLSLREIKQIPLPAELITADDASKKDFATLKTFIQKHLPNLEYFSLSKFVFVHPKGKFTLYPAHFSNIWPALEKYYYPAAREGARNMWLPESIEIKNARLSAKAFVLKSLIQDDKNPHFALVERFLNEVHFAHAQIDPATDDSLLALGDFNAFPRLGGFNGTMTRQIFKTDKARACVEMEKTFTPLYAPTPQFSFPSKTYLQAAPGSDQELLIDLAYYRGPLWKSGEVEVLPLAGSDHYPVYYKILLNP